MKVLVLGAQGMLGHKMVQQLSERFETVATVRSRLTDPAAKFCFSKATIIENISAEDLSSVKKVIDDVKPNVVINCIGVIKQLKSKDPLPILRINAVFSQSISQYCFERGIRFIHFSTDCVFSGRTGNYSIEDTPDCEDLYGISKLLGETKYPNCLTIRTSIIGRELRQGVSLIEWFLSQKGGKVKGYLNAIYTGFPTQIMSDIVSDIILNHPGLEGTWHISSDPISKYELLQMVNRIFDLNIAIEKDSEFHCDRRLDSQPFRMATKFTPPTWEDMILKMRQDPTPYVLN